MRNNDVQLPLTPASEASSVARAHRRLSHLGSSVSFGDANTFEDYQIPRLREDNKA